MSLDGAIKFALELFPGRTARELARLLYGDRAYQQLVNGECCYMLGRSLRREGRGGNGDPYRYYLLGR